MTKTTGFTQDEMLAGTTALLLKLIRTQMSDEDAIALIQATADEMRHEAKSRLQQQGGDWLEHGLLAGIK